MNKFISYVTAVGLLAIVTACSSKDESNAAVTPPDPTATAANPTVQPTPATTAAIQSLPQVSQAFQTGQYEKAVQTLVEMKTATTQMTDAQRLQYQQAVRDATTALLGAKDRDPAAKAAYEKLSRSATGR